MVPGLLSPTTDPTRDLACFAPFAVSLIERVGGRTRSWGLLDFEVTSRTPSISADSAVVLRNKRPGVPRTCHLTAALKFGRGSYATEGWSNSESRVEPRLPILPSGRESRMSIDVRTFQARGPRATEVDAQHGRTHPHACHEQHRDARSLLARVLWSSLTGVHHGPSVSPPPNVSAPTRNSTGRSFRHSPDRADGEPDWPILGRNRATSSAHSCQLPIRPRRLRL